MSAISSHSSTTSVSDLFKEVSKLESGSSQNPKLVETITNTVIRTLENYESQMKSQLRGWFCDYSSINHCRKLNFEQYIDLAMLHIFSVNANEAIRILKKIETATNSYGNDNEYFWYNNEIQEKLAEEYIKIGDFKEAERIANALYGTSRTVLSKIAEEYIKIGDFKEAERIANTIGFSGGKVLSKIAEEYIKMRDLKEAERIAEHLPEILIKIARIYIQLGQVQDAKNTLLKVKEVTEEDPEVLTVAAEMQINLKDPLEAMATLNKAVKALEDDIEWREEEVESEFIDIIDVAQNIQHTALVSIHITNLYTALQKEHKEHLDIEVLQQTLQLFNRLFESYTKLENLAREGNETTALNAFKILEHIENARSTADALI
ncbi:MAG: hypothetical protein COT84_08545 [Chlamydiae bacterium CG10_big_fil_rev_8_21_14_0_10_35_9]|nr:MAG: hypothetical protein COT84_08545 [Chlamydiae bacterium CG10_big_fil_rev_8_21_14_0_10_35_9]